MSTKLIGILFIGVLTSCSSGSEIKTPNRSSSALEADVHIVKQQSLEESIRINGTILANEHVDLKSEVAGRLIRIAFTEGSVVQKGQLLFQIDDREFQAQAQRLAVQLDLAKKENERNKKLFEAEAISEADFDAGLNKEATLQ
ncbi:MAG: biotin/lipoyl-binding protein, partial [Bacteroidota bacterium]|nr:biotin/lipoyl-binding protein [Bacteroidota bacterium]MDX5431153.1 biotin/lipoyl-binding protein [Bacteroidota bacterium]